MGLKFKGFRAKFKLKPKKKNNSEVVCVGYRSHNPYDDLCGQKSTHKYSSTTPGNEKGFSNVTQQNNSSLKHEDIPTSSLNNFSDLKNNEPKNVLPARQNVLEDEQCDTTNSTFSILNNSNENTSSIKPLQTEKYVEKSTLIYMTEDSKDEESDTYTDYSGTSKINGNWPVNRIGEIGKAEEFDGEQNDSDDDGYINIDNLKVAPRNQYSDQAQSIFFGGEEATAFKRLRKLNINENESGQSCV